MSGDLTMRPFSIIASSSMPQTFSPMVRTQPEMADADGQAVPVALGHVGGTEPGDDDGELELERVLVADGGLQVDVGEHGVLAVGGTPWAPTALPMMLKWEKSTGYSFSEAAVMIPNGCG